MTVTIRRIFLLAFLALGLVPLALASVLAFVSLRETMQDDIRRELRQQAGSITSSVDKLLFERLENAATWAQLDVMQDVQVGDVDRRISIFLSRLQRGYGGVYRALIVQDLAGKVVASSDTHGWNGNVPPFRPWKQMRADDLELSLSYPMETAEGETLAIGVPLLSTTDQKPIGRLLLELDWRHFEEMLDKDDFGGHMIAVVDDAHGIFAASRSLRTQTNILKHGDLLVNVDLETAGAADSVTLPYLDMRALVAVGELQIAPGSLHTGLRTVVLQSEEEALRPVRRLGLAFMAFSLLLVATIVFAADRVSRALAQPINALTSFSRAYRLGQPAKIAPFTAGGEIAELREAFVKMVDDVESARKKLIRTAKLAAVGEMASAIVHEIRTPLGIMRSSAQVLKRELPMTREAGELIAFIESETERLNRLVSSLLDNARPRAPSLIRVNCHELMHRVAAMLKPQIASKEVALHEQFEAREPFLACDVEQMTQVMLNLMQNALQAVRRGGNIWCSTSDSADVLCLIVDDDGPGIAAEDQAHVFEVFFSKREGGVGLGLAIVQQIVSAHGGDITVSDSPRGGARLTVIMPRMPQLSTMETI